MDDTNPTIEKHERYVVGAALARADLIDDIRDVIELGDFRDARLEAVFAAACSLHDANAPVDAVSVADALTRTGDLARVGGMSSLHDLVSEAAVPASAAWHAQRVRDAAVRRAVWAAGTRLREVAAAEVATQDEALAVVDAALRELPVPRLGRVGAAAEPDLAGRVEQDDPDVGAIEGQIDAHALRIRRRLDAG